MRIFDWIRRGVAEAVEGGVKDGLRSSGFSPAEEGEADESPRMALWLSNGHVKALPPNEGEKGPQIDDKAAGPGARENDPFEGSNGQESPENTADHSANGSRAASGKKGKK